MEPDRLTAHNTELPRNVSSRFVRQDLASLSLLVVAATVIRLYLLQFYRVISADGVAFANLARKIIQGHWADAFSTAQPPLYPLLIAAVHGVTNDLELAGRVAAALAGGLCLIPLYLLAQRLADRRIAIIACLLVTVWPSILGLSCEVMSQSTFMAVILTAYLAYCRMLKSPTLGTVSLTASLFAAAYLARPEGFIPFALLSGHFLLYRRFAVRETVRRTIGYVVVYWGIFFVVAAPYLYMVRQSTGTWQLSAKSSSVIGAALQEYLGRPDLYNELNYQGFSLLHVLRTYPDFVRDNTLKNLVILYHDLPPYLWLLAVIGLLVCCLARGKRLERSWLLLTFAPILLITVFYQMGSGYCQAYWPILFIWIGMGLVWIESRIRGLLTRNLPPRRFGVGISWSVLLAVIFAGYLLQGQLPDLAAFKRPYTADQDAARYDHKLLGLRLKKVLPSGSVIMTRSGRIAFYSDTEFAIYPQASLAEILVVARKSRVRYLVVDGTLVAQRPQLGILLEPLISPPDSLELTFSAKQQEVLPGIRPLYLYKNPASVGVVVYELL